MARKGRPAARIAVSICLALVLAGCTTRVITNVEVFHDLPADYAGQKVAVVAADPGNANTIEFRAYASKLAARLSDAGFQVVLPDPDQPPDYIAAIAYGVGAEQVGAAYSYGGVTTISKEYPRAIVVGIYRVPAQEREEPRQVYSMTALSTGRCRALSAVIDPILDAAFKDFPGESGRSETVTIPMPGLRC